jgi:hypothetical protein
MSSSFLAGLTACCSPQGTLIVGGAGRDPWVFHPSPLFSLGLDFLTLLLHFVLPTSGVNFLLFRTLIVRRRKPGGQPRSLQPRIALWWRITRRPRIKRRG